MTITLTEELEELITARVRNGEYESATDVIRESLRLLLAKEQGMENLRQEIMRGIADIDAGKFTDYDVDMDGENFSRVIAARGDKLVEGRRDL